MEEKRTKICSKCKEEKYINEFRKSKNTKDGLRRECISCRHEYYISNKDHIRNKSTNYYKENSKTILEKTKEYRLKNLEKISKRKRIYRKENREKYFARHVLDSIFTNWKGSRSKYEKLFGYTEKNLKDHLLKFGDIKELSIDHIIPINYLSKLIQNKEDLARWANRLSNLMLLDFNINSSKGTKLTIEYIPYWHLFDFMCYCLELEEFISNQDHHQDQ